MKNQALFSIIIVVSISVLTSCNKKYTCECYTIPGKSDYREFVVKAKNSEKAKQKCYTGDPPPNGLYCGLK